MILPPQRARKGDKIKLINDPRELTGTIITADYTRNQYGISWDDPALAMCNMPRESFLITVSGPGWITKPDKCECGLDSTRHGGKHSTWCPKYEG